MQHDINRIVLVGRLVQEPILEVQDGLPRCSLILETEGLPHLVLVEGPETARVAAKYLHAGRRLFVEGELRNGNVLAKSLVWLGDEPTPAKEGT